MEQNARPAALPVPQKGIKAAVLRILFPPRCAFCGRRGCTLNVCEDCAKKLKALCAPQSFPEKQGDPRWLDGVFAVWQYEGVARQALLSLKYYKSLWRSAELSRGFAAAVRAAQLPPPDMIIPVPDHPNTAKSRAYSLPELFGERIAREFGVPLEKGNLIKYYENKPQHTLSGKRRAGNPVGVYRVKHPERLQDKTVWLVDDIITTGATLNECARMLWLYGARQVTGLCLCVTMPGRKDAPVPEKPAKE